MTDLGLQADPETTGRHTDPTGYVSGSGSKCDPPTPTSKGTAVWLKGKGSRRVAPTFPGFKMEFGGLCERYAKNRSFWGGTLRPTAITPPFGGKTLDWSGSQCTAPGNPCIIHAFHGGVRQLRHHFGTVARPF